jgi:flagellar hook-associated protein 2
MLEIAKERGLDHQEHYNASKLIYEMKHIGKLYDEELTVCGIKTTEDGLLSIDASLAVQAAENGGIESLFQSENGFIARLLDKSEAIAINPMEYLEKTIITYPNSEKNLFRNPYITSMYSGLFFSSYC